MNTVIYNEHTTLAYEHERIIGSNNAITGPRYFTKVYLLTPTARYPMGQMDGQLDDEQVKMMFGETVRVNHDNQYGQQTTLLRKDLKPVRERGPAHLNPRNSIYGGAGISTGNIKGGPNNGGS